MTVDDERDLEKLKEAGRIVARTLQVMAEQVQPGITTAELDSVGLAEMERSGARSAPRLVYQFPGATCISINEEAAHGIPGERSIRPGDLVNLDVSVEKDGFFADAALTVPVPPVDDLRARLVESAQAALFAGIAAVRAGLPIHVIGKAVQAVAERNGFTIIGDLTGHGVGRSIHEEPRAVLNFYEPADRRILREGTVLTIEPFLSNGGTRVRTKPDGWTLVTREGHLSAQFEHTLVVTRGEPIIITLA